MPHPPSRVTPAALRALHERVDRASERLERSHQARLQCRLGCAGCCVDDLTVFEVEAARIRETYGELLAHGAPHAEGACAFLSDRGACRIYAARPYVCRTQGLPLRWIEEDETGEWVEYRDICPLNTEGDPPIEALEEDECFTLGPFEGELAALQRAQSGDGRRVALRALFEAKSA